MYDKKKMMYGGEARQQAAGGLYASARKKMKHGGPHMKGSQPCLLYTSPSPRD